MKFLLIFPLIFTGFFSQSRVIATYRYSKAKKAVTKKIELPEAQRAYSSVKRATFQAPSPEEFFQEFLRFKIGVEVAYHEPALIKSPKITGLIVSPILRSAFEQELYKALAELRLKNAMKALDKKSAGLSDQFLQKLYNEDPEFSFNYIAVNHPINPSPTQVNEAKTRAEKIYKQVRSSKKPFGELVVLHSDDKVLGALNINRSRAVILPPVYNLLKKMKPGQISKPVRVPTGYYIVRLNRRVPFKEADQVTVKANYFNEERTRIFNRYFDGLKKDFTIKMVNAGLLKSL